MLNGLMYFGYAVLLQFGLFSIFIVELAYKVHTLRIS